MEAWPSEVAALASKTPVGVALPPALMATPSVLVDPISCAAPATSAVSLSAQTPSLGRLPERPCRQRIVGQRGERKKRSRSGDGRHEDRKSTRLNSSHVKISYAVFC